MTTDPPADPTAALSGTLVLRSEGPFKLARTRELHLRLEVANVFDEVYELRDGSGIGVGAPQFGQRRGLYGGLTLAY